MNSQLLVAGAGLPSPLWGSVMSAIVATVDWPDEGENQEFCRAYNGCKIPVTGRFLSVNHGRPRAASWKGETHCESGCLDQLNSE